MFFKGASLNTALLANCQFDAIEKTANVNNRLVSKESVRSGWRLVCLFCQIVNVNFYVDASIMPSLRDLHVSLSNVLA